MNHFKYVLTRGCFANYMRARAFFFPHLIYLRQFPKFQAEFPHKLVTSQFANKTTRASTCWPRMAKLSFIFSKTFYFNGFTDQIFIYLLIICVFSFLLMCNKG